MDDPYSCPHNVGNGNHQGQRACPGATSHFARVRRLNKPGQRQLSLELESDSYHGSDDWYMRTSLGLQRGPAELAGSNSKFRILVHRIDAGNYGYFLRSA